MRGDGGCPVRPARLRGTRRAALNRIVARKNAQSFHLDQQKYPERPSINYARGAVIVMTMKHGPGSGVDRVDVQGLVDGLQLEPSDAAAADSARGPTLCPGAAQPMTHLNG